MKIKFQAEVPDESPAREVMQRFGAVGLPIYVVVDPEDPGVPMRVKATVLAVMLLAVVSVRGEQAVGSAAPAFSLKDLKGATVTMVQQAGKVVIVNFWATWCGRCKAEMPILKKLQQVHGPAWWCSACRWMKKALA